MEMRVGCSRKIQIQLDEVERGEWSLMLIKMKARHYKIVVRRAMMYGRSAWSPNKRDKRRLACPRKILGVTLKDT